MVNKPALLYICALILLTLPACTAVVSNPPSSPPTTTRTAVVSNPPSTSATRTAVVSNPPSSPPTTTRTAVISNPSSPSATRTAVVSNPPSSPPTTTRTGAVSNPPSPSPLQPAVQTWINQAKQDLATRQNLAPAEIEFLSFEAKTWSDSSLGCPQPGMRYLQVLKEGYLIRLRAGKEIYNYHGSGDTPPFLCQQPLPQISLTKQAPFNIKQTPTISVPPPRD